MICTSRRGISTVVTSAMLLTAVAVIGTTVVGWSNSKLIVFETSFANTTASYTNQINENLAIENVAFCNNCGGLGSKNVINITLTNTGTIPVKITQIQINSTTIKSYYYSLSSPWSSSSCPPPSGLPTCLPVAIMPKQSYTVSVTLLSTTWGSKKPDTITVTTSRGSIFTTQGAPP